MPKTRTAFSRPFSVHPKPATRVYFGLGSVLQQSITPRDRIRGRGRRQRLDWVRRSPVRRSFSAPVGWQFCQRAKSEERGAL